MNIKTLIKYFRNSLQNEMTYYTCYPLTWGRPSTIWRFPRNPFKAPHTYQPGVGWTPNTRLSLRLSMGEIDESDIISEEEALRAIDAIERERQIDADPGMERVSELLSEIRQLIDVHFFSDRFRIENALRLMLEVHSSQADRPDGQPYISHPLEVAVSVVRDLGCRSSDSVISALLHDALEDQAEAIATRSSQATPDQSDIEIAVAYLHSQFGERAAKQVQLLSNPDFTLLAQEKRACGDSRELNEIRNDLYLEHVREIADRDLDTFLIKLADCAQNALKIGSLEDCPKKAHFKQKYSPVVRFLRDILQSVTEDEHPLFSAKVHLLSKIEQVIAADYQE